MVEFQLVSEYPVRARRLFDLLRKPAFQEALALRFGALEVNATIEQRSQERVQMCIERIDPKLELSGNQSADKTIRSVVHHDWDLDRMESRWSHQLGESGWASTIEGNLQVVVLGREACRLVESGTISARLPLVGRLLEQKLLADLQARHHERVDFTLSQLGCLD